MPDKINSRLCPKFVVFESFRQTVMIKYGRQRKHILKDLTKLTNGNYHSLV